MNKIVHWKSNFQVIARRKQPTASNATSYKMSKKKHRICPPLPGPSHQTLLTAACRNMTLAKKLFSCSQEKRETLASPALNKKGVDGWFHTRPDASGGLAGGHAGLFLPSAPHLLRCSPHCLLRLFSNRHNHRFMLRTGPILIPIRVLNRTTPPVHKFFSGALCRIFLALKKAQI